MVNENYSPMHSQTSSIRLSMAIQKKNCAEAVLIHTKLPNFMKRCTSVSSNNRQAVAGCSHTCSACATADSPAMAGACFMQAAKGTRGLCVPWGSAAQSDPCYLRRPSRPVLSSASLQPPSFALFKKDL